MGGPICHEYFGQKLLDNEHVICRHIILMQDTSIRPKFVSFLMKSLKYSSQYFQVTMPVHGLTFFYVS